jgi:hypothetical protein
MKTKFKNSINNSLVTAIAVSMLIALSASCYAQDTISLFSKEKIACKVIEVAETEIKYKKHNFLDGPNYVADRYEVEFIKYGNGLVDSFPEVKPWFRPAKKVVYDTVKLVNNAPNASFQNDFLPDNKIKNRGGNYILNGQFYSYRKMGDYMLKNTNDRQIKSLLLDAERNRKMRYIGFAAIPAGILGVVGAVAEQEPVYLLAGTIVGVVCLTTTIANHKSQKDNIRKATKLYNQKF